MANLVVNNKNYTKTGNINIGHVDEVKTIPMLESNQNGFNCVLPVFMDEIGKIDIGFIPRINNATSYSSLIRSTTTNEFYINSGEEDNTFYLNIKNTSGYNIKYTNCFYDITINFLTNDFKFNKQGLVLPFRKTAAFDFSHSNLELCHDGGFLVAFCRVYDLNNNLVLSLIPERDYDNACGYFYDEISKQNFYSTGTLPFRYVEMVDNSYEETQESPVYEEILIGSRPQSGTTIDLSNDYHNYDLLKFEYGDSSYIDFGLRNYYITPSALDAIIAKYPNRKWLCLTSAYDSHYIVLTISNDTSWSIAAEARGCYFSKIYGLTCQNYDFDNTIISRFSEQSTIITEENLDNFDFLIITTDDQSDELIPVEYLIKPKNSIFECRDEFIINYGQNPTRTLISKNKIFSLLNLGIVEGIKLLPKTNT